MLLLQGTSENPGINQRALQLLFSEVQEKASDWEYTITVSVAEIYNEVLRWAALRWAALARHRPPRQLCGFQDRVEPCGMGSGVSLKKGVGTLPVPGPSRPTSGQGEEGSL